MMRPGLAFAVTVFGLAGLIGAAIVLIYTVLGGFRAACWTDLVQALIMVGTLVLFPLYLLVAGGGYDAIAVQMAEVDRGFLSFLPPLDDAGGGAALSELAAELDTLFAKIAREAAGS